MKDNIPVSLFEVTEVSKGSRYRAIKYYMKENKVPEKILSELDGFMVYIFSLSDTIKLNMYLEGIRPDLKLKTQEVLKESLRNLVGYSMIESSITLFLQVFTANEMDTSELILYKENKRFCLRYSRYYQSIHKFDTNRYTYLNSFQLEFMKGVRAELEKSKFDTVKKPKFDIDL